MLTNAGPPAPEATPVPPAPPWPRDRLDELATGLAGSLEKALLPAPPRGRARSLSNTIPPRLRTLEIHLKSVNRYFERMQYEQATATSAAEWVLDNHYIIQQAVRQVVESMPASYYSRLPKVRLGDLTLARVEVLAMALVRINESRVNPDQIVDFIQAFQTLAPLKIGEIWALPAMLRMQILESLAAALARITKLPLTPSALPESLPLEPDARLEFPQVEDEALVINGILSLRTLATQDWKTFFESVSEVERILREDPAGVYPRMDSPSRNRYRQVVEDMAEGTGLDEAAIAREAVHLAGDRMGPRELHVGYFLVDHGAHELEQLLSYRPSNRERFRRTLYRHATPIYLGSIAALTVVVALIGALYATAVGASAFIVALAFLLALLPASAIGVDLVNGLVTATLPPRVLPRLDFRNGVPAEFSTMVVIPALLTNESEFRFLLDQLETHYLGNPDPNIRFALLTDFADAPEKRMPGEDDLLASAQQAVQRLNGRHGGMGHSPFYFLHRERAWNESEGCWMGWERKRGKLAEFNNLVQGRGGSSFIVQVGEMSFLRSVRYVITLDADTALPRESAWRLIAALAHPLNQAAFDPVTGALNTGYTILQPRVQVRPSFVNRSFFTRIYSGDTILDLYTRAISDVYQDLFSEGSYVGKGIYDVRAFQRSLEGRVPDNTLLSHDLFEGLQGRCGLVSSVALFEDYPPHYLAYAHRLHRWIRGDWQLLPWLFPRVPRGAPWVPPNQRPPGGRAGLPGLRNELSAIDRWKLFDNLRRSLVSPAILAFLVCAWMFLPGSSLAWTALAISPLALDVLLHLPERLRSPKPGEPPETTARPIRLAAWRALFAITFLPHEAIVSLDAMLTSLWRVLVSHKRLLQWTTAAHTVRLFGRSLQLRTVWMEMLNAPLFALLLAAVLMLWRPGVVVLAGPFILLWMLSPSIAARISEPTRPPRQHISRDQVHQLRLLARQTWLFFEQFVGPEDHWLPPDHFQEDPRGLVAHRTSPTNIGLLLLSTLAAYDFGYIGPEELALRLRSTLDGMDQLERERGHLLNWYDTRTLSPLTPRYISTVDSGNLSAALLVLRAGCADAAARPVVRWSGLVDTLDAFDSALLSSQLGSGSAELHAAIAGLKEHAERLRDATQATPQMLAALYQKDRLELEDLLVKVVEGSSEELDSETLRRLSMWIDQVRKNLSRTQRDIEKLTPWALLLASPPEVLPHAEASPELALAWEDLLSVLPLRPTLAEVPVACAAGLEAVANLRGLLLQKPSMPEEASARSGTDPAQDDGEAQDWFDSLASSLEAAQADAEELLLELERIGVRAGSWFDEINFAFLFDSQREVFHIGYNVDAGRLDSNYYDLLASEARIGSLIAVARGDIPQSHWLSMARPITQLDGQRVLLSWSGTMFEYLMPSLLAKSYPNTLLDQSCRVAVDRQIAYAQSKKAPWGISESAYYFFDSNQVYQYRAFGIPELGYKRGLAEDLVVAPYASLLALSIKPLAVVQNIEEFSRIGMVGQYGLYEAADFSPSRLAAGQTYAPVRSYMAHHQGMIMLSLCNFLRDQAMVRRFHSDPRIATVQLLLQEQTPHRAPIEYPHPHEIGRLHPIHQAVKLDPWIARPGASYPQIHFLSNGNYGVLVGASGGGFSRWGRVDLTRWRADPTLDGYGTWIYIRDEDNGRLWSATPQPATAPAETQEVRFYPHAAEFLRRDDDLSVRLRLGVLPDADVEVRRVTISNHSSRTRHLSLTSYGEVSLAPQAVDKRHPAFNKLFIESEYVAGADNATPSALEGVAGTRTPRRGGVLLFGRRPRSAQDKPVFLAHFAANARDDLLITGYETDRGKFLGRGETVRTPLALKPGSTGLTNTVGDTLDPIFAVQTVITLQPFETQQVGFVTLAAASRREALAMAARYRRWHEQARGLEGARSQAETELVNLGLDSPQLEQIQKLLSALLYPNPALRADPGTLAANTLGQPGLWPLAISGDYPILLVNLEDESGLPLLAELVRAHAYWRRQGLQIDLVVLSSLASSYHQELQSKIYRLLARTRSDKWLGRRGGIFLLREDQLRAPERILLASAARVVLEGDSDPLAAKLRPLDDGVPRLPPFVGLRQPDAGAISRPQPVERPQNLLFDNGLGGFSPDGREYVIYLRPGQWTPAPWTNVIATEQFGFMVSEGGLGSSWAGNSGENRLTPWRNDPLTDPPAEAVYLRDEDTGEVWSPTPLPSRADAPYLIRHGRGYTSFEHNSHDLEQALKIFAVADAPLKIARLRLTNTAKRTRRISVTYYAEWVLGTAHEDTAQYLVPEFLSTGNTLLVHNPYNQDFGGEMAFLAASRELNALTTDRTEFLGSMGSYALPAGLQRVGLTATASPGGDPCTAMQVLLWLAPGESKEASFLLGQATDRESALSLVEQYQQPERIEAAWQAVRPFWDEMLGGLQVKTPDPALDLLLNHWLPYQALSCRIWGRSSAYQPGGAYGFRDQLQDVLAFLATQPHLAREHILRAAAHQFEQGDVLHWWHPPQGRGVRTRISDNLVWLPFATAEYVRATGDFDILDERVPFLAGEPLQAGEDERYGVYESSPATPATLFEHCRRALAKGLTAGPHGLPLMGAGDWNDGMNRVGAEGIGESVWLGWFLYYTLNRFAEICEALPGRNHTGEYRQQAETLRLALAASAWDEPDGRWFRRAYYDDGKPLGSRQNNECQIDSISQSWAVISGAAEPSKARQAMESLFERLVRHDEGLILLLAPPFDRTYRDPGYIKGYVPGIRENGGQYTHAALWAIWAFAALGEGDRAGDLLRLINPIYHADTAQKVSRYRVEPYVIAADVYNAKPPHIGRGGWTWYTGSASWMHRLGIEMILGIRRRGEALELAPCIPSSWPGFEVEYRFGRSVYHIRVENPDGLNTGIGHLTIDGRAIKGSRIPLDDDGRQHEVLVRMGEFDKTVVS